MDTVGHGASYPYQGGLMFGKPRKPIKCRKFIEWVIANRACLYCLSPANEPHHSREGDGPGRGSAARKPDDFRLVPTCDECHAALEGSKPTRLEWMVKEIGREDIYWAMFSNLLTWGEKEGWPMDEIYEACVDAICDWYANQGKS